jgi:hypothetical protein
LWKKIVGQAERRITNLTAIHPGPIRHKILPKALLLRIRLIHGVLCGALSVSLDEMIDGFKRDAHPEDEVRVWENICVAFLEEGKRRPMNRAQWKRYLRVLIWASMMPPEDGSSIVT